MLPARLPGVSAWWPASCRPAAVAGLLQVLLLLLRCRRCPGAAPEAAQGTRLALAETFEDVSTALVESLGGVSTGCQDDLRRFLLCDEASGLSIACSSEQLLGSQALQALLHCMGASPNEAERLVICQQKCLDLTNSVVEESVGSLCHPDYEAMRVFSADTNLLTVRRVSTEMNISRSVVAPLPNMKGLGGPFVTDYGHPSKCAQIPSAQYCVLSGTFLVEHMTPTFVLGQCLPKSCSEEELYRALIHFHGSALQSQVYLQVQCNLVSPLGEPPGLFNQWLQGWMGWGGTPVEFPNAFPMTLGSWVMSALIAALLLLAAAGTALDMRREGARQTPGRGIEGPAAGPGCPGVVEMQVLEVRHGSAQEVPRSQEVLELPKPNADEVCRAPRPNALEAFLGHWSLARHGRAFLRTRPPERATFACLDAVRLLSMGQVILGHTYYYALGSSNIANLEQFEPPYGLLGRLHFQIVTGCFYGVDSFFLMSGFFCAYRLQTKVFSMPENWSPRKLGRLYVGYVLSRWLRLVPLEMFVIFLTRYLLPLMGTGILWNVKLPGGGHCFDYAGASADCERRWWVNLLFLQDLDQYLLRCNGHTWYLAVDFHFYIMLPFLSLAYNLSRRAGWALLGAAMASSITITMAQTAYYGWIPEIITGSHKGFSQMFYFKPWCRAPAFIVGVALGWIWQELPAQYRGCHTTARGRLCSYALALLGSLLCCLAVFGRAAFFQCDYYTCLDAGTSPVSRFMQFLWGGFSISCWSIGLSLIMVLCFQGRFPSPLQEFLSLSIWEPITKLTYAAYLIHPYVLVLNYCQRDSPITWTNSTFAYNFVSFVVITLLAAFVLWVTVERPLADLAASLLGNLGK